MKKATLEKSQNQRVTNGRDLPFHVNYQSKITNTGWRFNKGFKTRKKAEEHSKKMNERFDNLSFEVQDQ